MASAKEILKDSVRFDALFDENTAVYGKEAFKDKVFQDLVSSGRRMEIDLRGDDRSDIIVRPIDEHASQGYNVFKDKQEYDQWLQQSMHEPGEEELMEALKDGAGT